MTYLHDLGGLEPRGLGELHAVDEPPAAHVRDNVGVLRLRDVLGMFDGWMDGGVGEEIYCYLCGCVEREEVRRGPMI